MDELIIKKVDKFFKQFKQKDYRGGEILIRADDEPSGIFYLTSGNVKQYAISIKGDEHVINIFKPFSFFPMSWVITKIPNKFYFEAMMNLSVWQAPTEKVLEFVKSNPDVLFNLMKRVYIGTDYLQTRVLYLMSGGAYYRLVIELVILARRFGKGTQNISLKFSGKDLAASTGITRETISREMKILKEKDLVILRNNKIYIMDLQLLEKELPEVI